MGKIFAGAALIACILLMYFAVVPKARSAECPNILIGDSLAVGMAPYARQDGFQVIAQVGRRLDWLERQQPRCAGTVVVVMGTNDLRSIVGYYDAILYAYRVENIMRRWPAERIVWATPGCFALSRLLDRGSVTLNDAAMQTGLRIHYGREYRCEYESHDGIHPNGETYRVWWSGIRSHLNPN